jgi:hypothetical protein
MREMIVRPEPELQIGSALVEDAVPIFRSTETA